MPDDIPAVNEVDVPSRSGDWLRPPLVRPWGEFLLVAALLMALPIRNSTMAALHGSGEHYLQMFLANTELEWAVFIESVLLGLFLAYLHVRGWRPADLRLRIGWRTSLQGIGLFVVTQVVVGSIILGLLRVAFSLQHQWLTFPDYLLTYSPHISPHSVHVGWAAIFAAMIVNAFFEEIVCMGYIFTEIAQRFGPGIALAATVFLRTACHTYQDPVHVAGIATLFTLYGAFYWWTRKLWPLVFAHMLLDIFSLSALKLAFS